MSEDQQDRTQPASLIQLDQATRRGDVTHSIELGAALQNLGGLLVIMLMLGGVAAWMVKWTRSIWTGEGLRVEMVTETMQSSLFQMASQLAPLLILLLVVAVVSYWIQSGFVFQPDRVMPRLDRLGPARLMEPGKTRKMLRSLVSLPKMFVSIGLAASLIWFQRDQFFELAGVGPEAAVQQGFGLILSISFQVALLLLSFGLVDYGLAWVVRTNRLQMSEQQVRDEQRMQQGDPLVQSSRRQRQQELARGRNPEPVAVTEDEPDHGE